MDSNFPNAMQLYIPVRVETLFGLLTIYKVMSMVALNVVLAYKLWKLISLSIVYRSGELDRFKAFLFIG